MKLINFFKCLTVFVFVLFTALNISRAQEEPDDFFEDEGYEDEDYDEDVGGGSDGFEDPSPMPIPQPPIPGAPAQRPSAPFVGPNPRINNNARQRFTRQNEGAMASRPPLGSDQIEFKLVDPPQYWKPKKRRKIIKPNN